MKITSIQTPIFNYSYNNKHEKLNNKNLMTQPEYAKLPTTAQYLAFTGGYSLDLAQTVKHLDKFAEKNSSIYPPNIREWLGLVLEEGNKAKETLVGVHKKYFASLKECFTLDEIKAKFPEFKNVLHSDKIEPSKGSLLDEFKKGTLEFFDDEEDLSVQLIKLYWGEGFSLNDLKRYANGTDLYYTMKKLQIPTASREYGHVLKFSDASYNERLSAEMAQKRLVALDRKAQLESGEPVYIPIKRGPLSPEHKKRISEGLKNFYSENPERIYEMSERMKGFYQENPEKSEELTRVLDIAWNIFGAENIKKAMSKYFSSKKITMFNLGKPADMTNEQSKMLKAFWGQNDWAKKSFSKNMKHAWKMVKEENEKIYDIDLTPETFKTQFFKWAEQKGLNIGHLDFKFKISKYKPELNSGDGVELSKYTPQFIDEYSDITHADRSRALANTYILTLINLSKELKKIAVSPKINDKTKQCIELIRKYISTALFKPGVGLNREIRSFDAREAQSMYKDVLLLCLGVHSPEKFLKTCNVQLNKAYEIVDKQPNSPVLLTKDMLLGVLK